MRALAVLVVVAACGGGKTTTCQDAITRAATRFGNTEAPEVATLIGACEQRAWSEAQRACIAEAPRSEALIACLPALDVAVPVPVIEASPATVSLVTAPIRALLFSNPDSEVGGIVERYLAAFKNITVEHVDRFIDRVQSEAYKVYGDALVLVAGNRHRTITIGDTVERAMARHELSRFDTRMAHELGELVRPRRKIYVMAGHGEMSDGKGTRRSTAVSRGLRELSDEVASLDPATLAVEVPPDATVLVELAPVSAPSPSEWAAIARYLDRGGSLLIAFDPAAEGSLGPLEAKLGIRFNPAHLVDDTSFLPQNHTDADHRLVMTGDLVQHPTTISVWRKPQKLLLMDSGTLEPSPIAPAGPAVTFTIRSEESSFLDTDGDLKLTAGVEQRKRYNIAAAIEGPRWRALAFADVDLFTDVIINNHVMMLVGQMFPDELAWLERKSEAIATDADVPDPPEPAGRVAAQLELADRKLMRGLAAVIVATPRERAEAVRALRELEEKKAAIRARGPAATAK